MKIKSKSERNALCFALVYYGFNQTFPQDVKLKDSTMILFEAIKHNIIAKNQGGRKKRFNNSLETDNKAISNNKLLDNNKADKQIKLFISSSDKSSEDISFPKNEKKTKKFIPPSYEDVLSYATERGRADLAKQFFDYFSIGGWKDSTGKSVINWKQKFVTWENHNVAKETLKPPEITTEEKSKKRLELINKLFGEDN